MKNCQVDIVLLSGYKRHGKDTFAECLKSLGFKRFAFADKLKETASQLFNVPLNWFYDNDKKDTPINFWPYLKPREIATRFGTESMRNNFDKDIWIRTIALQIASEIANKVHGNMSSPMRLRYVITDVRFPNEKKFVSFVIEELNNRNVIKHVRVNTIHLVVRKKIFSLLEKIKICLFDHPSEWNHLFMKYDDEILNFGTINDLNDKAINVYSIKGWKFAMEEVKLSS